MKYSFIFCFILWNHLAFNNINAQVEEHKLWTSLLQKYVDNTGRVDYKGFIKDSALLNHYLNQLEKSTPNFATNKNRYKAFWINAYNAYTIKLVIDHYPVQSIKEIGGKIPFVNSSWDIKFIHINKEILDLNNIEHKYL